MESTTAAYSREWHVANRPQRVAALLAKLETTLVALGDVHEAFTKTYIGFVGPRGGFASAVVLNSKLAVYFRVPFDEAPRPEGARMRDVAGIGHYGYGQTEYSIRAVADIPGAATVAQVAYDRVLRLRGEQVFAARAGERGPNTSRDLGDKRAISPSR
jgi:predicted transport protein